MEPHCLIDAIRGKLADLDALNTKLLVLVGSPGCDMSKVANELASQQEIKRVNVSLVLAQRLVEVCSSERGFYAPIFLRELVEKDRSVEAILLDHIELLFAPTLQINPLDLVRRLAHSKRVVAVWPGELRGDRLVYADMSHPEHRDYSRDGVVVLEI